MRALLLEDHLRHVTLTACPLLQCLDGSLTRFARLGVGTGLGLGYVLYGGLG